LVPGSYTGESHGKLLPNAISLASALDPPLDHISPFTAAKTIGKIEFAGVSSASAVVFSHSDVLSA
jgi:hypothetical protein